MDKIEHRKQMGERIRQLRNEAGMTQQDLADKTGLKMANIARIEHGKYNTGQDILSD